MNVKTLLLKLANPKVGACLQAAIALVTLVQAIKKLREKADHEDNDL